MNTSDPAVFQHLIFFYEHADTRVRDWPFMGSPYVIILAYACFVLIIVKNLPKIMENRDAFSYYWLYQPIDRFGSWFSELELTIAYRYTVTKFLYTLQSVAFVVRKRKSPVATYLLIHHTIFSLMLWLGTNFYPGGHMTFVGLVNSFTHFCGMSMRLFSVKFPK